MAEKEQPKKGSTSKFKDSLGKMDALVYNALGVNVESLCKALGIKSLAELFKISWDKINWAALLSLLYRLNPTQLKMLLSRFNLSSFNLRALLSIFGVPYELIDLLDTVRSFSSSGGGIFCNASYAASSFGSLDPDAYSYTYTGQSSAISGGSITPNTGWLPGDDEEVLTSMLAEGRYPSTGLRLMVANNPNDKGYVAPGSENVLNVLSGVESTADLFAAMIPQGGNGLFYYDYVETPVRFDYSKFVPWSDIAGYDFLRSYFCQKLGYVPSYSDFEITVQEERIDLIANTIFDGTYNPVQYWWIILMYNGIYDISELKTGTKLKAPRLSDLEDLYFRVKALGEGS